MQDLTAIEAFVLLALAQKYSAGRSAASLLLAGDEAQTVRPTDFEWAWLNDMLHATVGQPQEFKLSVNLRSPRRIADVVNRVWDLYDYLHKQDRPSGTGYAEIDDEGPDQILYAAVSQTELPPLLSSLSSREGLALIAFDKKDLPGEILPFVLSPAEAKGLDFHSICVVNGGSLLRHIVNERAFGVAEILSRRLAIDQLRVALSRPTERLLWVDAALEAATVKEVGRLLRPPAELALHPITAEALRTSLEEEELDLEERLQRCQKDAQQLVSVKPDMAWSRAQQAVGLLGSAGDLHCISDPAAREATYLTLAEVCFQLGFRKKNLYAQARKDRLAQRSVQILMKNGRHAQALTILERLPEAKPKLTAECYQETGQFAKAAAVWLELGDREKALKCYRSAADFEAALKLVRDMEDHPARPSLEWLNELQAVLAQHPGNFNRTMLPPEKKLLESMLERGLGVQRKKPAVKKKAAPGAAKTTARKRAPVKRTAPARD